MNLTTRLINYMNRYAPSMEKVSLYLAKKGCENIPEKLAEVGYEETIMIRIWIQSFVSSGKSEHEIKTKLLKKGFPALVIDESIKQFHHAIYDWDLNRGIIENQIKTYISRGKSKKWIFSSLKWRYSYFRQEIESILGSYQDDTALQKELKSAEQRYDVTHFGDRTKMIASLTRKGFLYADIKNLLDRNFYLKGK